MFTGRPSLSRYPPCSLPSEKRSSSRKYSTWSSQAPGDGVNVRRVREAKSRSSRLFSIVSAIVIPSFLRASRVQADDLGHLGFGLAVGGEQLGPLEVHRRQVGPARGVDGGHPRQVHPEDWLPLAGQGTLPALR